MRFEQALLQIHEVAHPEPHGHPVEVPVGFRDVQRVSGPELDPGRHVTGRCLLASASDHLLGEVQTQDLAVEPGSAKELEREISGAGCEIENPTSNRVLNPHAAAAKSIDRGRNF